MDLSVVIPVHNEEESIGNLIDEITNALSEKYQHEIIVVDDGSTDHTAAVCKAYDDPRIQYVYQENGERGRNCGCD